MKIVYSLHSITRKGGIERVVATKANYWAQQGHEVSIITTDQRSTPLSFDLEASVRHYDLGMNYEEDNRLGRWGRLVALYRKRAIHRERLTALLHELRADVVVSTFFQDASLLPDIQDGSRKVLELHSSKKTKVLMYPKERWLMRLFGRIRIWQNTRTAQRYDHFVILTEEERPLYRSLRNLEVIPNPRPFAPDTNADTEIPSLQREKCILAVGRHEYQKNFEALVRIWGRIADELPDWHLTIVGGGPLQSALQSLIDSLGLGARTHLAPATSQIVDYYRTAAVYAMTSHFEGLPMVLLEAQAMGLPIVSYRCPSGPADIVTDGVDGLLIETGDEEAFAQALRTLLPDGDRLMAMSREAVKSSERFALERIMYRWERLFGIAQ